MHNDEFTKLKELLYRKQRYHSALNEYHQLVERLSTCLEHMNDEGIIFPSEYENAVKALRQLLL